jgi:hypothetical protein
MVPGAAKAEKLHFNNESIIHSVFVGMEIFHRLFLSVKRVFKFPQNFATVFIL